MQISPCSIPNPMDKAYPSKKRRKQVHQNSICVLTQPLSNQLTTMPCFSLPKKTDAKTSSLRRTSSLSHSSRIPSFISLFPAACQEPDASPFPGATSSESGNLPVRRTLALTRVGTRPRISTFVEKKGRSGYSLIASLTCLCYMCFRHLVPTC